MKPRILLVSCEGLGNGGVQAIMMGIVRSLYKKFQFDILLFTDERRFYDDEFERYGGKIYRIPRYEGNNKLRRKIDYYTRGGKLYQKVIRLLKEEGPFDAIHCNDEYESAVLLKAAYNVGIPIRIMHTHVISSKGNILSTILNNHRKRVIEQYATKRLGCSKEACDSFYMRSEMAEVINNFYDDDRFNAKKYSGEEIKKEKKLQLLQIGKYSETKNQLFTLQILANIKKQRPDIKLILVGFEDGEYIDRMQEAIVTLELAKDVELLPSDTDTPLIMRETFALVCPSQKEGFGIVLVEAQAMGIRCYASDTIPQSTNCGGVTYLGLEYGAEHWAKQILIDYEKHENDYTPYDTSAYSKTNVMKSYEEIYTISKNG